MKLDIYCPTGNPRPQDRLFFKDTAQRSAQHVSSPKNIELNVFTDGSPASKTKPGGIGICFASWMPHQVDRTMRMLGLVVPGVECSNETEIVALADATLIVSKEIKHNIETLKNNGWSLKVKVSSDSLNALRFLDNPQRAGRLATDRAMRLYDLIQTTLSELNDLPVHIKVAYWWIPALSVPQHGIADKMSKGAAVKTGKAPLSQAMKIIFPKPTVRPSPPIRGEVLKSSPKYKQKEEEELEEGEILELPIEDDSRSEPIERQPCHSGREGRMGSRASRRQEMRSRNTASRNDATTTSTEIRKLNRATMPSGTAKELPECLLPIHPDRYKDDAFERCVRYAKCPESYSKLWRSIVFLPRHERSLVRAALQNQVFVNYYYGWDARHGVKLSRFFPNYQALYFPNIFTIVERTVSTLPKPERDFMSHVVEEQHTANFNRAFDEAFLRVVNSQNPRLVDLLGHGS